MSPNSPDFRHRDGETGLWIEGRWKPDWVARELAKGDIVWQVYESSQSERFASSKWQCLFDRPDQWLDCRAAKAKGLVSSKFPDFKRAEGEDALWLDSKSAPGWVQEKLKTMPFLASVQ